MFTSHSASVRAALFRPNHLKTTLSFAFNAGGITASVDQNSLVYDALKQLQAGQGRCWRLPEHSVMHLFQTWKPAQQQIAICRRCMPMALVSCTLQNLPDHCSFKHITILLVYCYQVSGQPYTAHTQHATNSSREAVESVKHRHSLALVFDSQLRVDIQHLVPIAYAGMPHDLAQTECATTQHCVTATDRSMHSMSV